MLSGGNSIWARVDLPYSEVGDDGGGHWNGSGLDSGMNCYGQEVRRFATAAANHRSPIWDGEGTLWEWRWRRWLLSGKVKNKNYFFIICNAKMYLMRNFASWTKMKSHDMNGDGMLDCCSTWFEGSAGSFFGSRDLVHGRLPIQKDRLVIMMSAIRQDGMIPWYADDQAWLESEIPWHGKRSRRYELGWHWVEVVKAIAIR